MYWDGVHIVSLHFSPNCHRWFFLIHNSTVTIKQQKPSYSEWWDIFTRMQNTLLEKAVSAAQQLNAASEHKRVFVSIVFAEGEGILVCRGPAALLSMLYTVPNLTSLSAGGRILENGCSFSYYWYLGIRIISACIRIESNKAWVYNYWHLYLQLYKMKY